MVLRLVRCLLYSGFDSDSEYVRLLLIQTPISQKLNTVILETFVLRSPMMVEVIGMTRQVSAVEKSSLLSGTKREGKKTKNLDDLLLSVVDETIKYVFGEAGTKVIYSYIENKCHLKREEIAEKTEVFSTGLKKMLSSGSIVIEKMILKNLYSKLQLEYEEKENYRFSDQVKKLREKCGC